MCLILFAWKMHADYSAHPRGEPGRVLRAPLGARRLLGRCTGYPGGAGSEAGGHVARDLAYGEAGGGHQLPRSRLAEAGRPVAGRAGQRLPPRPGEPGRLSSSVRTPRRPVQRIQSARGEWFGACLFLESGRSEPPCARDPRHEQPSARHPLAEGGSGGSRRWRRSSCRRTTLRRRRSSRFLPPDRGLPTNRSPRRGWGWSGNGSSRRSSSRARPTGPAARRFCSSTGRGW